MCNIAGYVGSKRAVPVLLEMIKKQEFLDGGLSTGIATVHEGKLYWAKVKGSCDDLIKNTNVLSFPGNIGIIHSRPDDNYLEHAHPFVSEEGKTAVVCNGNLCTSEHMVSIRNSLARYLHKTCNMEFESAISLPESWYPQLSDGRYVAYGETVAKTVEHIRKKVGLGYAEALADASSKLFSDVVNVLLSANSPDSIYVTRLSRPMNIMAADGECYISTSQFGFPEVENMKYMESLPAMRSCIINKDGFIATDYCVSSGTLEEYTAEEYNKAKEILRKKLMENEFSMDNMGGGILTIDRNTEILRPHVKATYDMLWDFHKEGILKTKIRNSTLPWLPGKIIKRIFFKI